MRQVTRYGVEIDVCPTSGGVWLDRGELEKIMAIIKEDDDDRDHDHDHDREDDHRFHEHRDKRYRKGSKMSKLLDVFDF